jgi:hypothetical protein
VVLSMADCAKPLSCWKCGEKLNRIFTPPQINVSQTSTSEDDVLSAIARSTDGQDKRAIKERYMEMNGQEADNLVDEKPVVSMDQILRSGIVQAAESGREAVDNWRKDHVRPELEGVYEEA